MPRPGGVEELQDGQRDQREVHLPRAGRDGLAGMDSGNLWGFQREGPGWECGFRKLMLAARAGLMVVGGGGRGSPRAQREETVGGAPPAPSEKGAQGGGPITPLLAGTALPAAEQQPRLWAEAN